MPNPNYSYKTLLGILLICFSINNVARASANPFTILLEHAKQGNVDAMFEVGKYYASGEYTEKNWQKSVYWYEQAIANNHHRAMLYLGRVLLKDNEERKSDIPRAMQLIEQAASAGDAEAQFQLGQLFESGKPFGKDTPSAIRWYRAASLQKYPGAKKALQRSIDAFIKRPIH